MHSLFWIWCICCYTQIFVLYEITPYCNYSLLSILLQDFFCSTIWNLVEYKLLFPVAIICCILTIRYIITLYIKFFSLKWYPLVSAMLYCVICLKCMIYSLMNQCIILSTISYYWLWLKYNCFTCWMEDYCLNWWTDNFYKCNWQLPHMMDSITS